MRERSLWQNYRYTEREETGCVTCGSVTGCDCIDAATEPDWYAPVPVMNMGGLSLHEVDGPVRRARCGYCGNNGTGIANPECPRPIHRRAS